MGPGLGYELICLYDSPAIDGLWDKLILVWLHEPIKLSLLGCPYEMNTTKLEP